MGMRGPKAKNGTGNNGSKAAKGALTKKKDKGVKKANERSKMRKKVAATKRQVIATPGSHQGENKLSDYEKYTALYQKLALNDACTKPTSTPAPTPASAQTATLVAKK
jgi:hypothetical protein